MATSTIIGKANSGTFTAYIPRLSQTVTFDYKEIAPECIVAQANFTANTSSQAQIYIDVDQSHFPFAPNCTIGRFSYDATQGICARRTSNLNIWFETASGSQVSGKAVTVSLLIWK